MSDPILVLDNVSKTFRRSGGSPVKAVSNVSLTVGHGETVALVGESGSGKSTLGRIALGLLAPDSGRVVLEGQALGELSPEAFRRARVAMQPIFQDASSSLNPRRSARELMAQALEVGLLINVTADNVIRIVPSLVINESEAREIVSRLAPLVHAILAKPKVEPKSAKG